MNNDIKEILDRLDYNEWEVDLYKIPITWTEMYDIRDYITNLQEENKRLKQMVDWNDKVANKKQDRIDKAIEYIQNHQLVFELSSLVQIKEWFDMFYKDLLNILRGNND